MGNAIINASAVILAGGESKRMGTDKASLVINGTSLVERVAGNMRGCFNEVILSTRDIDIEIDDVTTVKDKYGRRGPAIGLISAASEIKNDWVFVIACDMPVASNKLINYMSTLRDGVDMVVPNAEGQVQPLFAFYSKRSIELLKESIENGERGLCKFIKNNKTLNVRYVSTNEVKEFDSGLLSFFDLDTKEDIEELTILRGV